MRAVSVRLVVPAFVAMVAVLALAMAGTASAADVLTQCSGAEKVEYEGSTFQAPIDFFWTGTNSEKGNEPTGTGFNVSGAASACSGTQGSHAKPEVYYNQGELQRGSGSCLKSWGAGVSVFGEVKGGESYPRLNHYPFCATDEAPSKEVKEKFETFAEPGGEAGNGEAIESIPVLQGAVAVIVHLPTGCKATSKFKEGKKKVVSSRLALDQKVISDVYSGKVTTWNQLLADQTKAHGKNKIKCSNKAFLNHTIHPVVRRDKSGTTHIFKAFLEQVDTSEFPMEGFHEVASEKPCPESEQLNEGTPRTWEEVSEGCENQRWPLAAHVLRPATENGNPGVINEVNKTESSIGYADLAVAQELKFFNPPAGGEGKTEFWALVQNSKVTGKAETFSDPSTLGDKEAEGNSNCEDSVYVAAIGEEFPPASVRDDWSKVKAARYTKTYPICGLTYVLAARQYFYYLSKYGLTATESQKVATTVHDFLEFVTKEGVVEADGHDYASLPENVAEEAEEGAEEIGSKEA